MELLQLQYFQELARSGHLSKTAEKLHIAQPSLSQTLKRLENELGTQLFDRVGKHIELNASGKTFLKYVDEALTALNNATLELETTKDRERKTIELYVCSASVQIPGIIKEIQKQDPAIRLRIQQKPPKNKPTGPALYLTSQPFCSNKNKSMQILLKEPLKLALHKTHPLATKEYVIWEDIKNEPFISLGNESDLVKTVRHYCHQKGVTPYIATIVESPYLMRDLLQLNLGIAPIPAYTWNAMQMEHIVLKEINDLLMERYMFLSWDEECYQTPALQLCKKVILQKFHELSEQL